MLAPRSTSVVVVQEEARMLAARSFTLLVPAYLGSPGKGPLNGGACVYEYVVGLPVLIQTNLCQNTE